MAEISTCEFILNALKTRKAQNIVKICVSDKTTVADYFIIASAKSSTQVKSLAEFIEEETEKAGYKVLRKEGLSDARFWTSATLCFTFLTTKPACFITWSGFGAKAKKSKTKIKSSQSVMSLWFWVYCRLMRR